jgi:glycosyltransferase involved in cell wall biosynthesis
VKVLFIARASLFSDRGGDTVQLQRTVECLAQLGVQADIRLTGEEIDYSPYDLLHFFNLSLPADILQHVTISGKPFVVSPVLVDYREAEGRTRKGIARLFFSLVSEETTGYLKALGKRYLAGERIGSRAYWLRGHRRCIRYILKKTSMLLPNSESEYQRLQTRYGGAPPHRIIPNGIDTRIFRTFAGLPEREPGLVLCAGRIERRKNQLNLIRAVNDSPFRLILAGSPAVHQPNYYDQCRRAAGPGVTFIEGLSQKQLLAYYGRAQVHALPSWSETTGLSSLEAAVMGCAVVISAKGDTREYFENDAFYCDPGSPASIREAITLAAGHGPSECLRARILARYTWPLAGAATLDAYKAVLASSIKKP